MDRKDCTAETPMSMEDKAKYYWIHHDAVDVEPFFNLMLYRCPHCGLTFHALPRNTNGQSA